MRLTIGLNLLHAQPGIGGVWNYIENLTKAISQYDTSNSYIAFVTQASEALVPSQPNFKKVRVKIQPQSRSQRVLYENTVLQQLSLKYKLNCMHWFANTQAVINSVPAVVTVYDLGAFKELGGFPLAQKTYLRWMLRRTAQRAPLLLPMSQATADDLHVTLHVAPNRMTVVPVILSAEFAPSTAEAISVFRQKYHLPDQFWLYVAHLYPHKNHLRLLEAYHQLKVNGAQPWLLVLRGDTNTQSASIYEKIEQLNLQQDIIWLPRVDRSELPVLYSTASAIIFPSLFEGGGIPVVEAMACGCPVAASNIPLIEKDIGDAVLMFDPLNTEAIANAMLTFQQNPALRDEKRQLGLLTVENYRPQSIVPKLLQAYSRASQK